MLAVDTNVVVRLLVNDDERQARAARQLFESDDVWISVTVLLETAWVLESVYDLTPGAAAEALRTVLGLPNVHTEDAGAVAEALDAAANGIEFADALHLVRTPDDTTFATFDRGLSKTAGRHWPVRLV